MLQDISGTRAGNTFKCPVCEAELIMSFLGVRSHLRRHVQKKELTAEGRQNIERQLDRGVKRIHAQQEVHAKRPLAAHLAASGRWR